MQQRNGLQDLRPTTTYQIFYSAQGGLRRVCPRWMGDRCDNGRMSRGRKGGSTAKGFTSLCWGWIYIIHIPWYIYSRSKEHGSEQSVGGEVDNRVSNPYKYDAEKNDARHSLETFWLHNTTGAASLTFSLLSTVIMRHRSTHGTALLPFLLHT